MSTHEVTDYLFRELKEKRDGLLALKHQKAKLQEKIEQVEKEIGQMERRISELQEIFKKSVSDFNVDIAIYDKSFTDTQSVILIEAKMSDKPKRNKQTITDIVYEILKQVNHPLPIQEIRQHTEKYYKFQARRPETSITSALLRDNRFESVGRGLWSIHSRYENKNENNKEEKIAEKRENGATTNP